MPGRHLLATLAAHSMDGLDDEGQAAVTDDYFVKAEEFTPTSDYTADGVPPPEPAANPPPPRRVPPPPPPARAPPVEAVVDDEAAPRTVVTARR